MAYSTTIYRIQEWLRKRVRRNSGLWRFLVASKTAFRRLDEALRRGRWRKNEHRFGEILSARAVRNPEFFFVQIGAHDGSMDDPIGRWVEKYRWRGIFVEPQREQFERLTARYRGRHAGLIFENVAIDRTEGFRQLYKVAPDAVSIPEQTGLASFFPDRALSTYSALGRMTSETVRCVTLPSLLQRHGVKRLDLLQIDTEGYEFEIIKLIDFAAAKPALIHYEHRHLNRREHAACRRLLRRHGYRILEKQFDDAAVLEE